MAVLQRFLLFSVVFIFVLTALSVAGTATGGGMWKPSARGITDTDFRVVYAPADGSGIIYAATQNTVYKTENSGETWMEIFSFRSSGKHVFDVISEINDVQRVYVCSSDGLYRSTNGGDTWERIFSRVDAKERAVLSMAVAGDGVMYAGTGAGIFISRNTGKDWKRARNLPSYAEVIGITVGHSDSGVVFAVTDQGLYKGINSGEFWKLVYETPSADDDTENSDEDAGLKIRNVSFDHENSNVLYGGTSRGLLVSRNAGGTWTMAGSAGLLSRDIRHIVVNPVEHGRVYAATRRGVFSYSDITKSWEELYKGLSSSDVRHLAFEDDNTPVLWAATGKGIFQLTQNDAGRSTISAEDVLKEFSDEPTIGEIREAAIRYADVHPEKIKRWKKAAGRRAWLPEVKLRYQTNSDWQSSTYFYSNSTQKYTDDDITEGDDQSWSVSMEWELGDLVWNNDKTSIESRSRQMVQLRDDVLNEVTRLYFERRRLQVEMITAPPPGVNERIEKELRLRELTAHIDSLTGSYLTHKLNSATDINY